jgi:hypothetical protein
MIDLESKVSILLQVIHLKAEAFDYFSYTERQHIAENAFPCQLNDANVYIFTRLSFTRKPLM